MAKPITTSQATTDAQVDRETAIDTHEVARLLGHAEITLHQMRARGEGPPFFRIGRSIRFRLGDVLDYRDARIVGKRSNP